jgi:hypothetical protein
MEYACALCYELVTHNKPHSALKKISQIEGSTLYKCSCCYSYLHRYGNSWEIISGGEFGENANYPLDTDTDAEQIDSPSVAWR